jgi:hypothetical protein
MVYYPYNESGDYGTQAEEHAHGNGQIFFRAKCSHGYYPLYQYDIPA